MTKHTEGVNVREKISSEQTELFSELIDDKPKHYQLKGLPVEPIDVMYASVPKEWFIGFCHCCAMKYLMRFRQKGGLDDIKKAKNYIEWEIAASEREEEI